MSSPTEATATPVSEKGFLPLALLLSLVIFVFPLTVPFPLLDPDEGLHATIAQNMAEEGDWLMPHYLKKPFYDKPIFYFWCQAASLKLFGMNEAAVRLPGLLFGLLGTITTGLLAGRLFGRTAGWVAFLFYGTMILPVALAQAAAHDVALIPEINLALLLFWQWEYKPTQRNTPLYLVILGAILGLSVLTKGLVGLAVVGLAWGGYLLLARRLSWAACARLAGAFGVALLLASAWFFSVENDHAGYLYYFFVQRHLLGFATATQSHGQAPWWYYLPVLFGGGLPWIGYLPAAIRDAWNRKSKVESRESKTEVGSSTLDSRLSTLNPHPFLLLWCWLVGWTALMFVGQSKLVTYLWPVFPAVAILAAVPWSKLLLGALGNKPSVSLRSSFFFSSVIGPVVLPLVALAVEKMYRVDFSPTVWTAVIVAGIAPLAPLVFFFRKQWRAMLTASIVSTAVQFVAAIAFVLPPVADQLTAKQLAAHLNAQGAMPERLVVAKERVGSLIFYLDPEFRRRLRVGQIEQVDLKAGKGEQDGQNGKVEKKDLESAFHFVATDVIAIPERRAEQVEKDFDFREWKSQTVGRHRIYRKILQ